MEDGGGGGVDFKLILFIICLIAIIGGGTAIGKGAKVACEVGHIFGSCPAATATPLPDYSGLPTSGSYDGTGDTQVREANPAPQVRGENPAVGYREFGSIAYSPSTGVVTSGFGNSHKAAEDAAVEHLYALGGADGWRTFWFENGWEALAWASNGSYGAGYGYSDDLATARKFARRYAIENCEKYGGADCQIVFEAYTAK